MSEQIPEERISRADRRWQRRLLPFMTGALIVLAILFFAISFYDAREVRGFVAMQGQESVREQLQNVLGNEGASQSTNVLERSLLLLEAEAMDKRYAQATALLMSRVWARQLTFITGMVLAFMGAVFILGKLREGGTEANLGTASFKAAITSSSPGLVLAFLGTTLIAITMMFQPQIGVQDRPVYIAGALKTAGGGSGTGSGVTAALDPGLGDPDGSEQASAPANAPGK
jgi:hypothetical protein